MKVSCHIHHPQGSYAGTFTTHRGPATWKPVSIPTLSCYTGRGGKNLIFGFIIFFLFRVNNAKHSKVQCNRKEPGLDQYQKWLIFVKNIKSCPKQTNFLSPVYYSAPVWLSTIDHPNCMNGKVLAREMQFSWIEFHTLADPRGIWIFVFVTRY